MSALANHAFSKMNGIGNEIVVIDLRDGSGVVTPDDARAVAAPAGVPYDQLMVLRKPRLPGTEAFVSIYNNDGTEAVTNTFNGLTNGATFNVSGIPFKISYTGGTGNDVVLTQLLSVPSLTALPLGNANLKFSWPTNYTGFTLESNTNLTSTVWSAVVPLPVISGTNYVATNNMTGLQKFFRLRSP